ncbi:unnamed protein product [Mycena citricolor]|uniref:Uncharacterized protein n=1 Tax=Mycena citricolor TaxID=2018698 RepID=A0AAD2Q1U2_9AGAR|nr:unnamed protein product [Mycena citricolor]
MDDSNEPLDVFGVHFRHEYFIELLAQRRSDSTNPTLRTANAFQHLIRLGDLSLVAPLGGAPGQGLFASLQSLDLLRFLQGFPKQPRGGPSLNHRPHLLCTHTFNTQQHPGPCIPHSREPRLGVECLKVSERGHECRLIMYDGMTCRSFI